MSDISPELSGRTLGNWTLVRLLGEGGFGAVYEAQHTTIAGRRAAVKVLHPHLSFHKDIKRRFIAEASIASQAEHENIVQVFDGGVSSDGICYVAMEMLKGRSLASYIHDEKRLDSAVTLQIAIQIASALETAHGLGVVHRDLKPDNIFIIRRKTNAHFVKVLDFGIAKLHTQDSKTATGTLLGTPLYMSPEQWQTLPDIDGRSDLYALGVILYECLTGKPPYDGETNFVVMMAHIQKEIPDPAQLAPVPEPLSRLVKRLLAKQREERPATARALLDELKRLAGEKVEESAGSIDDSNATLIQLNPFKSPKSLSIRQQSGELIRSTLTQRKLVLSIGGGAAVLVALALGWLMLRPSQALNPQLGAAGAPNNGLPLGSSPLPSQVGKSETHDMGPTAHAAAPASGTVLSGNSAAPIRRSGESGKPPRLSAKKPPSTPKPKPEKSFSNKEHELYVVPIIR